MTPSGMLALAVLALARAPDVAPARDSARAHQLTQAALDQEAALNLDSALALYRAARRADSTDVVAEYFYVHLRMGRYEYRALSDEYAAHAAAWKTGTGYCWGPFITSVAERRTTVPDVVRAERETGVTPCSIVLLGSMGAGAPPADMTELAYLTRAVRVAPRIDLLWNLYSAFWERTGPAVRAESAWREADAAVGHPLLRVSLAMVHAGARLARGDTAGARALQRSVRSAVLRDGRPGVAYEYLRQLVELPALARDEGGEDQVVERILRLTAGPNAQAYRAQALSEQGKKFIDRGEPLKATPPLSRAIAIADSLHVSDLQLEVRTLRGRAYTKAGRFAEAEQDLRVALVAGEHAARLYYRADALHNLAHLYESEGRWPEASNTVDRFVTLAKRMPTAFEITSLLDAGEIRWKAGWHASAEAAFREMVRAIEDDHAEWNLAGEFFERGGDLARAQLYYTRAIDHSAHDTPAMAGMARVHEALGHADSAETWARSHDAQVERWPPREIPLLPAVLARGGHLAEATRIARDWAARQVRGGNAEGAAIARLQLAQLLLDAGRTDSALAEAARADSLAQASSLTREMIRARTLRGVSLVRLRKGEAGVRALENAAALARRHPSADILFETQLALGDALAATGHADRALSEYDRAARAVAAVTAHLPDDFDRAGYRQRHLRPFDGAIRVLLESTGRASRTGEIVRWSSRRSAAALALAAAASRDSAPVRAAGAITAAPPEPSLADVQQRLGTDEVLLDYLVLDSTVAAVVVTRAGARIARLPISADALRARVATIRGPLVTTVAGRIDLARAGYALGAAAELYTALIAPFAPELGGKKRLLVVPDGPLHALAFDALVVALPTGANAPTDYGGAKYLLDAFEVEYLPSPAFLHGARERSGAKHLGALRLLAVGYDAPGSAAEIEALRESWPPMRLTALEGSAATERAVKTRAASFGVLHFAVHAVADAGDPLASHLRLAADSVDDGYLHANEIVAARLAADLVVLSACETNAGPIYGGEGVMGIARAFLGSGARAVVGTEWPIGAESAELMREFYRRLALGDAVGTALRAAKLTVRRSALAHPFHWAGFVLVR